MGLLASDSIPPLKQGDRRHTGLAPPVDPITNPFAPYRFEAGNRKIESVADDHAISTGSGNGDLILLKK